MLPYSHEVLVALLAQYNADLWPWQVGVYPVGLLMLYLAARPRRGSDRALSGLLAAAWLWTAGVYFLRYLAPLDFAAPIFAGVFAIQGLLLTWSGALRGKLSFGFNGGVANLAGMLLVALTLAAPPLVVLATDRNMAETQSFAITPLTVSLATLGFLLLTRRAVVHLAIVPLLWTGFEGFRGWYFDAPGRLAAAALALLAVGFLTWRRFRLNA
jgi:hypothetical protein